jgi:ketosteroid isomerase-like protein
MNPDTRTGRWIEGYLAAWNSSDPQEIGALFADGAEYFTSPYRAPWSGREAIVAGWLERRDEPGTWTFQYDVLVENDELGVVQGETRYLNEGRTYSNLWLVRLDGDGRCTKFVEYYMLHS